jgi:tetratricopeptide (TPR) repeat protein
VLLLVDHARPAMLGELVRALLPMHPELEVHTEVQRVLDVPHGSTLVLVPRAEDADWLNINRPVFAQRELRVVLFCDTETSIALARQAVDFFDWISHRVECPNRPPRFAVEGLRFALAARAPGIMWWGGDLEATFAAARPRGKLHKVSAARPYGEVLAEVRAHRRAWIAFSDVNSPFRLRHVRWALAEAGHRTRAILVEPTVSSPGWWQMHAHIAAPSEARAELEKAGTPFPGRLAALNEFEPEAIKLMQFYLENGFTAATLEAMHMGVPLPELKPIRSWEEIGQQFASRMLRGEAPIVFMRAFAPGHLRQLLQAECTSIQQRLEKDEQVEFEELASWTAWTTRPGPELSSRTLDLVAELWLRSRPPSQIRWDVLLPWAIAMMDLDVAESWAQRALSENHPHARLLLANVRLLQGRHDEAVSLTQDLLTGDEQLPKMERARPTTVPAILSGVLIEQGKYREAETLLRQALSASEHEQEKDKSLRGALLHQLARTLSAQGRYGEAETLLRQSLDTSDPPQGINLIYQRAQLNELARILSAQGKYDEAELLLRQTLSLLQSTMGNEPPLFGVTLHDLATLLLLRGRHTEAEPLFRQALAIKEHTLGIQHHIYARSLSGLAATLRVQGKYEEAEASMRQALAIAERALGREHHFYGASLHVLASILQDQGKYAEAETLLRQALAIQERALGPAHAALCPTLSNLGVALGRQGRSSDGAPFITRALEIAHANLGSNHPETALILNLLAQAQHLLGKSEAPETARQALDSLTRTLGPDHPYTQGVKPTLQAIIVGAPLIPVPDLPYVD